MSIKSEGRVQSGRKSTFELVSELARQMEGRRREEKTSDYDSVRRGWCLGGEEFRRELLAAAGAAHLGAGRQHGVFVHWMEKDLPGLPKSG